MLFRLLGAYPRRYACPIFAFVATRFHITGPARSQAAPPIENTIAFNHGEGMKHARSSVATAAAFFSFQEIRILLPATVGAITRTGRSRAFMRYRMLTLNVLFCLASLIA